MSSVKKASSGSSQHGGQSSKGSNSKPSAKTSPAWQSLGVFVHRASPLDCPEYRHVGLRVLDHDEGGAVLQTRLLHVTGSAGIFQFEESDKDPAQSKRLAGFVNVASIPLAKGSENTLRNTIRNTPVNNSERDWNCQSFVGDALSACYSAGLITAEEKDIGINGMVDLVLEAPDSAYY